MKDSASGRNCTKCAARDIAHRTQYKKADSRGTDVGDTSSVTPKFVQGMQHLATRLLTKPRRQAHILIASHQVKLPRMGKKTGSSPNDNIEFPNPELALFYALAEPQTWAFFSPPSVLSTKTSSCTAQQGLMRPDLHCCAHELIRMQVPSNTTVSGGTTGICRPRVSHE